MLLSNYPQICKSKTITFNDKTLPREIMSIINSFLSSFVHCKECISHNEARVIYALIGMNPPGVDSEMTTMPSLVKYNPITVDRCTLCKIPLCPEHAERAKYYYKFYKYKNNGLMCNECCWDCVG